MNTEQFKGKAVIIKSTGQEGVISNVTTKYNAQKIMTARFTVEDPSGRPIEYMPHEVEIVKNED